MTYQRRKDERPGEILNAAFEAFVERSFAKTSMSDIAKQAGVSRPTLYLYYESKEEIFSALIEDRLASVVQGQPKMSSGAQIPAKEQLELALRMIITHVNKPEVAPLLRLLITEGPFFPELLAAYKEKLVDPGQRLLKGLVHRGVYEGEFGEHALALDPKVLVSPALMSVVWSSLFMQSDPIDTDKLIESYLSVLMPGLGPN